MQGIGSCVYYGLDDYVPNSPNPEAARNDKLDFSSGDKITYTDTDSCWDCSWESK